MKARFALLLFFTAVLHSSLRSQVPDIIEGDFAILAETDTIAVQKYTSGMTVAQYPRESNFLKSIADQKELIKQWEMARDSLNMQGFIKGFNQVFKDKEGPQAHFYPKTSAYTLIVKTVHTEIDPEDENSIPHIRLEYIVVDSKSQRNQYARYYHTKVMGSNAGELSKQLSDAYQRAGKFLAQAILNPPQEEQE